MKEPRFDILVAGFVDPGVATALRVVRHRKLEALSSYWVGWHSRAIVDNGWQPFDQPNQAAYVPFGWQDLTKRALSDGGVVFRQTRPDIGDRPYVALPEVLKNAEVLSCPEEAFKEKFVEVLRDRIPEEALNAMLDLLNLPDKFADSSRTPTRSQNMTTDAKTMMFQGKLWVDGEVLDKATEGLQEELQQTRETLDRVRSELPGGLRDMAPHEAVKKLRSALYTKSLELQTVGAFVNVGLEAQNAQVVSEAVLHCLSEAREILKLLTAESNDAETCKQAASWLAKYGR